MSLEYELARPDKSRTLETPLGAACYRSTMISDQELIDAMAAQVRKLNGDMQYTIARVDSVQNL